MHLPAAPMTILVIDGQQLVLDELAAILVGAGYLCQCAKDADAANVLVRQVTPELIISDVNLAGHSGLTLCDQLKHQPGLGEVPVMFLSAAQVPDIIRRSHADGGTYYLRKPFDKQVLLELVDKAITAASHPRVLARV